MNNVISFQGFFCFFFLIILEVSNRRLWLKSFAQPLGPYRGLCDTLTDVPGQVVQVLPAN